MARFGHDMILLENGTGCNAEACGVEVHYRDDTAPVAGRPLISSLAEVADLQVPDPYVTFPMSEILKATRILAREVGDKAWICARADQGPMDLAAQLRGDRRADDGYGHRRRGGAGERSPRLRPTVRHPLCLCPHRVQVAAQPPSASRSQGRP